ncbi:DinB family protein [Caballeronia sordidicola]|uniref:DinB family protein n=1 Tax=Caballeronia sordidicola TaxID=196367 RepID=UPI000A38AB15|nr:DinB family protein [Caballeronia sordidicola]
MINSHTARVLARYRTWANNVLFDSMAALPLQELVKLRKTLFKSMIGTANHNLVIDLIWQAHLVQKPHVFKARDVVLHADLADFRSAQGDIDKWFENWSDEQTDTSLAETLSFAYVSGERSAMTRGAMFIHLVNHSTHHRGWICEMFFDVPMRPPVTDLPVFLDLTSGSDRITHLDSPAKL